MKFKKALKRKVANTIENPPITIRKKDGESRRREGSMADGYERKRPRIRLYTPLSEEQMDLYEIDPEFYERLEDEGTIDKLFD
jgi:hypothetical protein